MKKDNNIIFNSDAYNEGFDSCFTNGLIKQEDNPYKDNTEQYIDWNKGYIDCFAILDEIFRF